MDLFRIRAGKLFDEKPIQSNFRRHIHAEYEIFCFLSGDAVYSVEGNIYTLTPGDILLLKASETHNLILKSDIPYERIIVHFKPADDMPDDMRKIFMTAFTDRPIGHYNLYSSTYFNGDQWLYFLDHICEEVDKIKQQVYLMALLQELSAAFPLLKEQVQDVNSDIILKVTHYIEKHLKEPLSLERICSRFFISEAQLTRNFKKNLGTTVGEYILTKRLMLAYDLMKKGQKPTEAYVQCGFRDYSSFYRAYKKKFGCSPKLQENGWITLERVELS